MTERPSSKSRWRVCSACCSSYSAPASCSTSRRCCAVASAEPAQRLRDEPLPLGLGQRRTLGLQARHDPLVGGTHLLGGPDLLGAQLRVAHRRRLGNQLFKLLSVAAVPGPQCLDLSDTALVLRDDPLAALVGDVEQRALEFARDPLQVLRPVPHACCVVGSGC
jgi:hypothetical protein